jgi:hypothetical protein
MRTALLLILFIASTSAARAQDARLARRLDATTAAQVNLLLDSAQAQSLPVEPLVQKALEGASKQAAPEQIVAAVRALLDRLQQARSTLNDASEGELVAGAVALQVGAQPADLKQIHASRSGERSTAAFVGLTFLLQRGIANASAVAIMQSMLAARLNDADFVTLQRLVEQDLRAGAQAEQSARVRSRALIRHGPRLRGGEQL